MNRNTLAVVAALALLGVGAAAFLLGRTSAPPAADPATPPLARGADADAPARIAVGDVASELAPARALVPAAAIQPPPPPPPVPPLPPHDVPLADIRAELEARARSGDRRAACRLATDLIRCQSLPMMRAMTGAMERSLEREGAADEGRTGFRIDMIARTQNRLETLEPLCAGIEPEDAREGFDWLLRAAELGHVPSMVEFARRPAVPFQSYLNELDRLRVYRDRAPEIAMRAIAAGDASLLPELASAHLSGESPWGMNPLQQLARADDATAYAYWSLFQRVAPQPPAVAPADAPAARRGTPPAPPQPIRRRREYAGDTGRLALRFEALDPETRARGEALADQLENRYFETGARSGTAPTRAQGPFDRMTPDPARCDAD